MSIENLISNGFKAKILGKKYNVKFEVRNFIALKDRFNMDAHDLTAKVLEGELDAIIQMIWCGTLEFAEFDLSNPACIKEEISLEKLYKLPYAELRVIGLEVVKGLLDSLPKTDTKKKRVSEARGLLNKIKTILKIK